MSQKILTKALLEISKADTWDSAVNEWELDRKQKVESGLTVVANIYRDLNLIQWEKYWFAIATLPDVSGAS